MAGRVRTAARHLRLVGANGRRRCGVVRTGTASWRGVCVRRTCDGSAQGERAFAACRWRRCAPWCRAAGLVACAVAGYFSSSAHHPLIIRSSFARYPRWARRGGVPGTAQGQSAREEFDERSSMDLLLDRARCPSAFSSAAVVRPTDDARSAQARQFAVGRSLSDLYAPGCRTSARSWASGASDYGHGRATPSGALSVTWHSALNTNWPSGAPLGPGP